ncbi:MAG: T9SS type A sorting domain-containing protein [Flavobacteriales bacterium]|nr:T9SS type A sorting domain-containing protein [Flavobacteriales bacterium]
MKHLIPTLLLLSLWTTVSGQCPPPTGHNFLDINNVRTRINVSMSHWWDEVGNAVYEVPKDSGVHSIFAGAIWFGGVDEQDSLRLSAMRYTGNGAEYWPGPLSLDGAMPDTTDCQTYDRVWKVSKWQVAEFRQRLNEPGYVIPQDILDWPAHGNIVLGQSPYLAPYMDVNGNGNYDPLSGDYPAFIFDGDPDPDKHLLGDQALWWVANDRRDISQGQFNGDSGGLPIGMEIHCMAYAFRRCDALDDQTFYRYQVINRGQHTLADTYMAQWVDVDLGFAQDDYVACDVQRGMGYGYNGNPVDGTGGPLQYGLHPPAMGIDILKGNVRGESGANTLFNPMAKFMYHNNDGTVYGDPQAGQDYYNYMRGIWRDGTPMCYGGNGHPNGGCNTGVLCDYMFPGDSDPFGIGTGGIPQPIWTEEATGNLPFDRRFLMSAGPFTFSPGDTATLHLAAVWGRTDSDADPLSITALQEVDDYVQSSFDAGFQNLSCCPPDAAISYQWPGEQTLLYASIAEGNSYLWDFGDGTTSTERFPTHTYPSTSTYVVCPTVTNACGTDTHCETLDINALGTSFEEAASTALSIFPNPTSNGFHLQLGRGTLQSVVLTDALGKAIIAQPASGQTAYITTDGLAAGLYMVTIRTDSGSISERVVIE